MAKAKKPDNKEKAAEQLAAEDEIAAEQLAAAASAEDAKVAGKKNEKKADSNSVQHRGKTYRFALRKFILPGLGQVLAEDAATDSDLIETILSIEGQGVLRPIH